MAEAGIDGRRILEGAHQQLGVSIEGAGVLRLTDKLTIAELDDPEEQIVDVVGLFAALAERGFFTTNRLYDPIVVLELLENSLYRRRWHLDTTNVDVTAFRLLSNLMVSVNDTEGVFAPSVPYDLSIDVDKLAYPPHPIDLPFRFCYEPPSKSGDERFVRIEFRHALRADAVDRILRDLDLWASLLIQGGYRDDRNEPTSGAAAEQPILEGTDVVGISIPIVRDCSEAMYCSLLNYAERLHAQEGQIVTVSIECGAAG